MQKSSLALKSALALTLLLAPLAGWGQTSEWKWLTGGNLKAVKFVGQKGWIIGDDGNQGIILHTTDGGATWAIQPHNTGRHYFWGLSFCDSLNGIIVGGYRSMGEPGFTLRTSDGGQSWFLGTSPTTYSLSKVCFFDVRHIWATSETSAIFRTTDGGNTWQTVPVDRGYQGIDFLDSLTGFAVSGGTIFHIAKTTDGGLTWVLRMDNTVPSTSSIDMADSLKGGSAGTPNSVVITTDAWQTWTQVPCGGGGFLNNISFYDSQTGFMVGGQNNHPAQYYKTTNGGLTWAVDSITQNRSFAGVDAKQLPVAWIAGEAGSILKTTNSGNIWTVIRNADIGNTTFLNASFRDVNQGWAVGTYGVITHTMNGGTIWTRQTSGTQAFLWGVDFPSLQSGWVCGESGTILATANGGTNWGPQTSNTTMPLFSIDFPDSNTLVGVAVGGYYGPLNPVNGEWLMVNGKEQTTLNGEIASSFRPETPWDGTPRNDTPWMDDTLRQWGTGLDFYKWPWRPEETILQTPYRTIIRTTNGGALWIAQNTTGQVPLYGVSFVTPNDGWACGDPQGGMGVILHTTDSGATWTGQNSNVNQTLNWIQFRGTQNGWCVGSGGTVLWTTDRGTTWNQGNSGTTSVLRSCGFYDNQNGFACGDSGLIIGTTNGGRNWQLDTSKVWANLTAISALDSLHAWAVGSYGMVLGWRMAGTSSVEQRGPDKDRDFASLNRIKAYPNPFVSFARIPGHEKERFVLYDITGRRVGTYKGDKIGADASAGVYFLMAESAAEGLRGRGAEGKPIRIVKVK